MCCGIFFYLPALSREVIQYIVTGKRMAELSSFLEIPFFFFINSNKTQ